MDTEQETIRVSVDGHGDVIGGVTTDSFTYDFGTMDSNIAWPSINVTGPTGSIYPNVASPTITIDDTVWSNGWANPSGHLTLRGDDADIDINGVSLMETIRGIQDRLNILCPDPEMEQEWEQLREIRAQYEAKLAECREKSRAWRALQQHG